MCVCVWLREKKKWKKRERKNEEECGGMCSIVDSIDDRRNVRLGSV